MAESQPVQMRRSCSREALRAAGDKQMPPFLRALDRLKSEQNPWRTDTNARMISWDSKTGAYVAEPNLDVMRSHSSCHTCCGTLGGFAVFFFVFAYTILDRWAQQAPLISETTTDAIDAGAPLPDTALTLVLPDMSEGEVLKYVWPVFLWTNITYGFERGGDKRIDDRVLDPLIGREECELDTGYDKDGVMDYGKVVWPVFCIKDNNTLAGNNSELKGRFGDPEWSFLGIKLMHCGASLPGIPNPLSPRLQRLYDAAGGTCATQSEREQMNTDKFMGWQCPLNVWFRFQSEDWSKEQAEAAYESGALPFQSGPLQPKTPSEIANGTNPADSAWSWVVYETPSLLETTALEAAQNYFNIDLRLNTAKVDPPGTNNPAGAFGWNWIRSESETKT